MTSIGKAEQEFDGDAFPGHYLTDGDRLYRVVTPFRSDGSDPTAELEDCLTLELRVYTARELLVLGLRRVECEPPLVTDDHRYKNRWLAVEGLPA